MVKKGPVQSAVHPCPSDPIGVSCFRGKAPFRSHEQDDHKTALKTATHFMGLPLFRRAHVNMEAESKAGNRLSQPEWPTAQLALVSCKFAQKLMCVPRWIGNRLDIIKLDSIRLDWSWVE